MERYNITGRNARAILGRDEVALRGPAAPMSKRRPRSAAPGTSSAGHKHRLAKRAEHEARLRPATRPRSAHKLMARDVERVVWDGTGIHREDTPSAKQLRTREARPSREAIISSALDFYKLLQRELHLMGLRPEERSLFIQTMQLARGHGISASWAGAVPSQPQLESVLSDFFGVGSQRGRFVDSVDESETHHQPGPSEHNSSGSVGELQECKGPLRRLAHTNSAVLDVSGEIKPPAASDKSEPAATGVVGTAEAGSAGLDGSTTVGALAAAVSSAAADLMQSANTVAAAAAEAEMAGGFSTDTAVEGATTVEDRVAESAAAAKSEDSGRFRTHTWHATAAPGPIEPALSREPQVAPAPARQRDGALIDTVPLRHADAEKMTMEGALEVAAGSAAVYTELDVFVLQQELRASRDDVHRLSEELQRCRLALGSREPLTGVSSLKSYAHFVALENSKSKEAQGEGGLTTSSIGGHHSRSAVGLSWSSGLSRRFSALGGGDGAESSTELGGASILGGLGASVELQIARQALSSAKKMLGSERLRKKRMSLAFSKMEAEVAQLRKELLEAQQLSAKAKKPVFGTMPAHRR